MIGRIFIHWAMCFRVRERLPADGGVVACHCNLGQHMCDGEWVAGQRYVMWTKWWVLGCWCTFNPSHLARQPPMPEHSYAHVELTNNIHGWYASCPLLTTLAANSTHWKHVRMAVITWRLCFRRIHCLLLWLLSLRLATIFCRKKCSWVFDVDLFCTWALTVLIIC